MSANLTSPALSANGRKFAVQAHGQKEPDLKDEAPRTPIQSVGSSAFSTPTRPAACPSDRTTPARRSLLLAGWTPADPQSATQATRHYDDAAVTFGTLPLLFAPSSGPCSVQLHDSGLANDGPHGALTHGSEGQSEEIRSAVVNVGRPSTPPASIKRRLDTRGSISQAPPAGPKRPRYIAVPHTQYAREVSARHHPIAALQSHASPRDIAARTIHSILAASSAEDQLFFEQLVASSGM